MSLDLVEVDVPHPQRAKLSVSLHRLQSLDVVVVGGCGRPTFQALAFVLVEDPRVVKVIVFLVVVLGLQRQLPP